MSKETSNDAPIPMTPEQKFFFDLRGWILLPSILSDSEIEEMKAEVYAGARQSYQGALQTTCLLYTSPSPRDRTRSRMPSSA